MGTHCSIAIECEPGRIAGIYCHWDGYISNNGLILYKFYYTPEKITALIALGSLSSLCEKILPKIGLEHSFTNPQDNVCVAYHRDRDEPWAQTRYICGSYDSVYTRICQQYNYLWRDGQWWVAGRKGVSFPMPSEWTPLAEALEEAGLLDDSKGMTHMTNQEAYCQYLREWADYHSGVGFEGMTPACFDEWADSERQEIETLLTTTYFLQVNYEALDRITHDTVVLILPDTVTREELQDEIQSVLAIYGGEEHEDEDMLTMTDEMLDQLVSKWGGCWNYLNVVGTVEVNGHEREFLRM